MLDSLFFVALPYVAIVVCVIGSIYRITKQPMTYSALSSQFLEKEGLLWGSLPWHIGITIILLGHILAFLVPGLWQSIMANQKVLMIVEALGLGLSYLCLLGLGVLLVRRLTSAKVQSVTTTMDLVVLALLLLQVVLGIMTAMCCRWGASWCSGTTTPYLWSIVTFQPNIAHIEQMPLLVKAHIIGAWLFIIVIPFSRLIHMFAAPFEYLTRPPQNVLWINPRRFAARQEALMPENARRHFVRAGLGIGFGTFLLSLGTVDKVFSFFFGPRLGSKEETELMEEKLARLESTVGQRKLELERQSSQYISVASLSELNDRSGKYFIDYQMQPAIAFKGKDQLPLLISAKCTHLGCTVGNQVDEKGNILCPCHVSYFDIVTGMPNAEAPAKAPLAHLAWVIMDEKGEVLVRRQKDGKTVGSLSAGQAAQARVYISKNQENIS
jgi:nitrate reductase gamma subunit